MNAERNSTHRLSFLDLIRPYKPLATALCALLAANIALQILAPQALGAFIDAVEAGGAFGGIALAIALYLLFTLMQTAASALMGYLSDALGARVTDDSRARIMAHYLGIGMDVHNHWRSGDAMTRLDEDAQGLWRFSEIVILRLTSSGILLLCVLVVLMRRSLPLAGVLLVVSALAILGFKWIQDGGVAKHERAAKATASFNGLMKETLETAVETRAFGAQGYAEHRMKRAMKQRLCESFPASLMYGNLWSASTIMQCIVVTAALAAGMALWDARMATVGDVFLIFTYTNLVIDPLQDFRNHMGDLQGARAGMRRVADLLAIPSGMAHGSAVLPRGAHALHIRDLHFAYGQGAEALRGMNLAIEAGERVCLAGETGCGKSTLAALVARLYEYERGEIRLGGVEIRDLDPGCLRARIAFLPQEPQLLHATLRDNIALYDDGYDDASILCAAEAVGLRAWIERFPEGLDTVLALGGGSLSAGEGQLVTIIRLALRDPSLVILDEMTARLDADTERRLLASMRALCEGRTVLAIAHRSAAFAWADRRIDMENGMVKGGASA